MGFLGWWYWLFPMLTVGFRFRAYGYVEAVKAQLEIARELYNTLRWADIYFYSTYGTKLSRNELRQLAPELRRQDKDFRKLYSQVTQNVADRLYNAKERYLSGLSKRYPRERRIGRYYSLTYPQSGWKVLSIRPIRRGRKRLMLLRLSGFG